MNIPSVYFKLVLGTLFCLVVLCSCGGKNNSVNEIPEPVPPYIEPPGSQPIDINDPETVMQIRQDYLNYLADNGMDFVPIDDVLIDKYFGTYNGYAVVLMYVELTHAGVGIDIVVDGILFSYATPVHSIIAWRKGQIFELREANDLGLLSREDLIDIAGNQYSLDGNIAGLSVGVENRIKYVYLDYLRIIHFLGDLTTDDVWIEGYYGTYRGRENDGGVFSASGLIAVMMNFTGSGYTCEEIEITIDGILFHYNSGNSIAVWVPNNFELLSLQEAYDLGLLAKEDLVSISSRLTDQVIDCHINE